MVAVILATVRLGGAIRQVASVRQVAWNRAHV